MDRWAGARLFLPAWLSEQPGDRFMSAFLRLKLTEKAAIPALVRICIVT
jgi:hypothetical protein